ncbi:MAG: hypothetical protein MI921_21550, partial [Cytophagales bacterium]|nr:hypothetical protein [Cytophagales bacterium]
MPIDKPVEKEKGHQSGVVITALEYIPPKSVVTGCERGKIVLWSIESGYVRGGFQDDSEAAPSKLVTLLFYVSETTKAFGEQSATQSLLFSGHIDGLLKAWNVESGEKIFQLSLEGWESYITAASTLPLWLRNEVLLFGTSNGTLAVCNHEELDQESAVVKPHQLPRKKVHSDQVTAIQVIQHPIKDTINVTQKKEKVKSGNKQLILSSSLDMQVKITVINQLQDSRFQFQPVGFFGSEKRWNVEQLLMRIDRLVNNTEGMKTKNSAEVSPQTTSNQFTNQSTTVQELAEEKFKQNRMKQEEDYAYERERSKLVFKFGMTTRESLLECSTNVGQAGDEAVGVRYLAQSRSLPALLEPASEGDKGKLSLSQSFSKKRL